MSKPDAVFVIGVARSGTSCVSGMLERLGVSFDDGALLEPTEFNPRGYFESRTLNGRLDRQIQARPKGEWQAAHTPLILSVRAYLDGRADRSPRPWGVKDTRLVSCGVPVVEYLRRQGLDVRVVTTRRAAYANGRSLQSWHSPIAAQKLSSFLNGHLRKTERALRKAGVRVATFDYERILAEPDQQAAGLAGFVGATLEQAAHAAQFVDPSLNHHGKEPQ